MQCLSQKDEHFSFPDDNLQTQSQSTMVTWHWQSVAFSAELLESRGRPVPETK